ncbi:uncharacterized protein LOC132718911 [Ruditapes philippinarum]|uniref:uncharacterized protein LOC132718911 n=1 Tax=Ruditapes philippinarum TaxID=129788 RepID=UPI00295BD19F|nr:uncharacterized protein LOC132718911 [Ruditapes philippinarum]
MVSDITDPMSVSMAKTHFSEGVELDMRHNGDIAAADLCRDIRNWWESEDRPGISASTRIKMRKPLRKRLLSLVNFFRFPPAKQYVCGWPVQLWEALLANIDAKAYLYSLVHNGTYNPRAFSSMIGETFFSELTLNDRRGQGTVSASEFGQYIGHATEQVQIRLDEDRNFSLCTSKKKVYDVVDEPVECGSDHDNTGCMVCRGNKDKMPQNICPKDHPFDNPERRRLPGRRNRDHIPTDRNALQRGTLGVRFEKARCNMSKMMATDRMGIDLNN